MVELDRELVKEEAKRISQEFFEKRKVKAMIGNLDFHGALEKYLNIKVGATDGDQRREEKQKKEAAFKNLKDICLALDPTDARMILTYIQESKTSPIRKIIEESASRSNLTYDDWFRIVEQTFFINKTMKK